MTKSKVMKSAKIPKVGTAARKKLLEIITEMLLYKKYIEKGRRFFLKERLVEIEETYKETGLSWEEIDTTVSEQGLTITQATFRKYLREELIPNKAFTYKKTTSGRIACYDASIISHINLVLFLFNVPSSYIDQIINELNVNKITAKEAIESKLSEDNLYPAIFRDLYQNNGADVSSEISEVLKRKHPEVEAKAQKLYAEIKDIFDKQLTPKVDELIKYLNNCYIALDDMVDTKKLLQELEEL
jgi:hypothetical protein